MGQGTAVAWTRQIIEWNRPPLESAAQVLISGQAAEAEWNFSNTIVVFPRATAREDFLTLLKSHAEAAHVTLLPPVTTTVDDLPSHLLPSHAKRASPLEQQLAWLNALRSVAAEELSPLTRRVPAADDWTNWSSLARQIYRLREILGAERMTIESVAARDEIKTSPTQARWTALSLIEQRYRQILREADRIDTVDLCEQVLDEDATKIAQPFTEIVLVAVVTLPKISRALLTKAAETLLVRSLVYTSSAHEEAFDSHGCLRGARWRNVETIIPDERMAFADNPTDEARLALSKLALISGEISPAEFTFGIGDQDVYPRLACDGMRAGATIRTPESRPYTSWPPVVLLRVLITYSTLRLAEDLASLLRHPDLGRWLEVEPDASGKTTSSLLQFIDHWRATQLPATLSLNTIADKDRKASIDRLQMLLDQLPNEKRSISDWTLVLTDLLRQIYPEDQSDSFARETKMVLPLIFQTLEEAASVAPSLVPIGTAEEAFAIVLQSLRDKEYRTTLSKTTVRALTFKDLLLDSAKHLVVVGMNERRLPNDEEGSIFLTTDVRYALDIPGPSEWDACDRYMIAAIVGSRPYTFFIAGRASADGEPLLLSRLLLDGTAEQQAKRLLRFFKEPTRRVEITKPSAAPIRIVIPQPEPHAPIDELSVTAFRDYLTCPYRFYLRHILKLRAVDDKPAELDPLSFGILIHDILHEFGKSKFAKSQKSEEIFAFLEGQLLGHARDRFAEALPAVAVQIEQIRARLEAYAHWQAHWTADGWNIAHVEVDPERRKSHIVVDEKPFYLSGRIDRIDVNSRTGQVAIMDYKTSEAGDSPEAVHQSSTGWVDLQLPLYRHLLTAMPTSIPRVKDSSILLAYMVLPKDVHKVGIRVADWSKSELAEADETAASVIRGIREGKFFPPRPEGADRFPEYARICQDGMEAHD